jgi:hypothetical protein
MALTLKGEQTIGTKFAADVSRLRLIGVRLPATASIFKGIFNTVADLTAAYPPFPEPIGNIAFVRGGGDEAGFYRVILESSVKDWRRAETAGFGDTQFHIDGEVGFESEIQKDVNLDPVTLSFTQPTQVGEHLTLAANYHFAINVDESNDDVIIIQGLKFLKETGDPAPNDETPYYYWGLGTDKWAAFSEDGEYVVTNWTLEV